MGAEQAQARGRKPRVDGLELGPLSIPHDMSEIPDTSSCLQAHGGGHLSAVVTHRSLGLH